MAGFYPGFELAGQFQTIHTRHRNIAKNKVWQVFKALLKPFFAVFGLDDFHANRGDFAAAAVAWALVDQIKHGKPSLLGAVTGAVAGLVAITPASGFATPLTSILLGFVVSPVCFFFVSTVKNKLKYDDTLDVFGVHCIGGIIGALGTAIVADPALGGQGFFDYTVFPAGVGAYDMAGQFIVQAKAVGITLLWSGIGSAILFFVIGKTMGLRPTVDQEREGLDLAEHGERAYNY